MICDSPGVYTGTVAANMAWLDKQPTDRLAAIQRLQKLLPSESDLLERHFMFNELERLLYKSRDAFSSALFDYENACVQHNAEMDAIRPLLIEALDGVPALPTYKQVAIMKAKTRDWEGVVHWCKRGLDLYGDAGLRDEDTDDLKKRLARAESKLADTGND